MGLCLLLYLGYCVSLIPVAADDIRMVSVFSLDESAAAQVIQRLYRTVSLDVPSFKYGGGFYYPVLAAAVLWDVVGSVSDRFIVIAMRAFGTLAGVGCLWLTYRLGRSVFGHATGVLGTILLAMTPTFLRWSVEGHPDLPQLFWILCCLHCCLVLCQALRFKYVLLASLFAGLAFGTKYAGVFLLPVIAAATLLPAPDGHLSIRTGLDRLRCRTTLVALGAIPVLFLAGFVAFNPYAPIRFGEFVQSLATEQQIMAFGHTSRVEAGGVAWLWLLAGSLGMANAALLVISSAVGLACVLKRQRLSSTHGLLLVWVVSFLGYLVLESNLRRSRHLLPILPIMFLFLADIYRAIWAKAGSRWPDRSLVHLILPLLLLGLSWGRIDAAVDLFDQKWRRCERSPEIEAGRWLKSHHAPTETVLYDAYAYVPPEFDRSLPTAIGISYPLVVHLEPDLIVVREAMASGYRDTARAAAARIGADAFLDRHAFYTHLEEGRIPDYALARDFGSVAIYQRSAGKRLPESEPGFSWPERVNFAISDRYYAQNAARMTMGTIAFDLGRWEDAIREYRLGTEVSPDDPALHYWLGRALLSAGRANEAETAFERVFALDFSRSAEYNAASRHTIARHYFEAGRSQKAVTEAERALKLDPDLRQAHFDLAMFHLVGGEMARADSIYAEAVGRFGPDSTAVQNLNNLIRSGIRITEARSILESRF